MKITIYKSPEEYLTRDYDLTVSSFQELKKTLYDHCEAAEADPSAVAVYLPAGEYTNYDYIIKRSVDSMGMDEVAGEIMKIYKGAK